MNYDTDQKAIPVTIIGGYLGAGKTTLLNHILRNNAGLRLAVLVNDFGKINIDAELIDDREGDNINLANGCICCSLAGGFGSAMLSLRERDIPPERVVIEASGISDPFKVAQFAHMSGFQLDSVVVVADVESIQNHARNKYIGRQVVQQLKSADILLVNKIDLVSSAERLQVIGWLRDLVPDIRILESQNAGIPTDLLFANEINGLVASRSSHAIMSSVKPGEDDGKHIENDFVTWSFSTERSIEGAGFRRFIDELGSGVLRGKGILCLSEDPSFQYVFQMVGKRWSLAKRGLWKERTPKSELVLIGLRGNLDGSDLSTRINKL